MRVVGYVLLAALGVLVLLLLAAVIRTLCMKKKTSDYTPHPDAAREREYAEKLSRMVAYETVSHLDDPELEKFRGFHKLLAELYPTVHEKLEKTEIDGNLLFFWEGKNHDRPLVLMSHQDVVPAEGTWEHAPFSGDIADGKVWGRGASDTKCSVMGFFQACEELLREGYVPEQDVYLSSLLYGGVRRTRRRQARGRAASAGREAVPRLRRGRRHHLRAHRRHSWEFRHARRI